MQNEREPTVLLVGLWVAARTNRSALPLDHRSRWPPLSEVRYCHRKPYGVAPNVACGIHEGARAIACNTAFQKPGVNDTSRGASFLIEGGTEAATQIQEALDWLVGEHQSQVARTAWSPSAHGGGRDAPFVKQPH